MLCVVLLELKSIGRDSSRGSLIPPQILRLPQKCSKCPPALAVSCPQEEGRVPHHRRAEEHPRFSEHPSDPSVSLRFCLRSQPKPAPVSYPRTVQPRRQKRESCFWSQLVPTSKREDQNPSASGNISFQRLVTGDRLTMAVRLQAALQLNQKATTKEIE